MAVLYQNEYKYIIDRTLVELTKTNKNIEHGKLQKFSTLLTQVGADFIELDSQVVKKIGKLSENTQYIFRIENEEDIGLCHSYGFKYCIVDSKKLIANALINRLKNVNVLLEININRIDDMNNIIRLKSFFDFTQLFAIRVRGLINSLFADWSSVLCELKQVFNVKIDICPHDQLHTATAMAVEATYAGADFITTTFTGKGQLVRFAPLEEVLLGLKVVMHMEVMGDTSLFNEMKILFQSIEGANVQGIKPVVGDEIFRYESGIHADGIQKNASTYEPYEPKEVGQKRKLIIGKHSGTKAVIYKLKELYIDHENKDIDNILVTIRKMSIQLKREIFDSELILLCDRI